MPDAELPGAIRMTRPEDVAAGVAPAFASAAPALANVHPTSEPYAYQPPPANAVITYTTPEPSADLTIEEARAEVARLTCDLDDAIDVVQHAREMCDHAEDGGLTEVPIARVREWLEGPRCGRQIMAERGRSITEAAASRDTMREAIAFELHAAGGPFVNADANALTTAVLAVRDAEMERLRAELDAERGSLARWLRRLATERTRAEEAEAKVAAVLALHQPRGVVAAAEFGEAADCSTCGPNAWPCTTFRALAAPAGQGDGGGQ